MSDPPRLRDLPEGEMPFARELLRGAEPSRAYTALDAVRLQAKVAAAATSAPAGAALTAALAPKVMAVVMAVAVGGVAVRAAYRPEDRAARSTEVRVQRPAPVVAPRVEAPVATPVVEAPIATRVEDPVVVPTVALRESVGARVLTAPRVRRPAEPAAVAAPAPTVVEPPAPPSLADEMEAINEARASMRGDPSRAAQILTALERSRPGGQMRDERDAVLVEALARGGRWDEARSRAADLERRAPGSPQSARVRELLRDAP